ncbi:MAG: hypothetical protein U1C19_08215 [Methanobacteriaceae archaeon]|nr:hypothetical protein [Methanobacteriaceae archaeon]
MVTEDPTIDEIYALEDESLIPEEFTPTLENDEVDEQLMLVAILALLYTLYTEYEYKTPEYILSHLPVSIKELEAKTQKLGETELKKIVETHKTSTLTKTYGLAKKVHNKIQLDFNLINTLTTMKTSITGTLNQLRDDIITKAHVFKDKILSTSEWNIKSNFKRAIRRTKNYVRFNAQNI